MPRDVLEQPGQDRHASANDTDVQLNGPLFDKLSHSLVRTQAPHAMVDVLAAVQVTSALRM